MQGLDLLDAYVGVRMNYYTTIFTEETYSEFIEHGSGVSGHGPSKWKTAQKVNIGDRLLCYVAGLKKWVGVLEVTGEPYLDEETRIWAKAIFPVRIPVKPIILLSTQQGALAEPLLDKLIVMKNIDRASWGILFQTSLREWPSADGELVELAINDAAQKPSQDGSELKAPAVVLGTTTSSGAVVVEPTEDPPGSNDDESAHKQVQYWLAFIGTQMGYQIFVPPNDRRGVEAIRPERLSLVDTLNLAWEPAALSVIKNIDVLWLRGNTITCAFEIEKSTSVYSGLLRIADLANLIPNLQLVAFIVAPLSRRAKVQREINRPTFAYLTPPLATYCKFISFETLESTMRKGAGWQHLKLSYVIDELGEDLLALDL